MTLPLDRPWLSDAEVSEAGERRPGNPIPVLPQAIRLTPVPGHGTRGSG